MVESMDLQQRVNQHFNHSVATNQGAAALLAPAIAEASELMTNALLRGNKIMCCGAASSGSLAQYFAAMLLNRYERERPGLPAVALNGDAHALGVIASNSNYREVFSKQLRVLALEGDILVAICVTGNSKNTTEAIKAAHERGMSVVILSGQDGGDMAAALYEGDIEVRVPAQSVARIQEVHMLVLHSLCDLIDIQIFGEEES
jgi:D-sedoheptulose 7-phosphate isomerase